jgi:hypothetical protein
VSAALTRQNTTRNSATCNTINAPSQDVTALQPKVFLTGTHQLLVIKNVTVCLRPTKPLPRSKPIS